MHVIILGRTLSGKSALVKQIGSDLREQGHEVVAFNPVGGKGFTIRDEFGCAAAEYETADADEFMNEVLSRLEKNPKKKRFLIVDEAHEFFGKADSEHRNWIGTRGRHYGLTVIALTQKATILNTTFRGQADTIYIFRSSLTDARFVADEFGNAELQKAAVDLPRGHYIKLDVDGNLSRGKI